MPATPRTVVSPRTRQPFRWILGTTITDRVTAQTVGEAAQQVYAAKRANPRANGWMIDAAGATGFALDAMGALQAQLAWAKGLGIAYVAVVLPPDSPNAEGIITQLVSRDGFELRCFPSAAAALAWLDTVYDRG